MTNRLFGSWGLVLLLSLGGSAWLLQSHSPVLGTGRGINHVEVAVRDLSAAAELYHRLGFTVGSQGKFPSQGLANMPVRFKDRTYLELISTFDRERAAKNAADMIAFLDKHEGAIGLGLDISSADETAAYLRARGFDIDGPTGGTFRPDGVKQAPPELWKDVSFKKPALPGDLIFFVEYHHDAWRKLQEEYPSLRDDPAKTTHANGALSMHAVWMSVKNLEEATKAYEAVGFFAGAKMALPAIGAIAQELQAGDGTILLVSPNTSASDGAVKKFLADRGESVMGASIEVQNIEKTKSVLEEGLHQKFAIYSGPYGKSIVVPGEFAAGVWMEFFERAK